MEYKQLEYFVKICETHSFSAAARELYVTPQGISKSIDKLEKELGVPLFARTRTGIELTAMGQELYKHARPHLKQWEYIKERVAGTEKRSRQSLAIGFDEGTLDQYAVQFLPDFLSAHPEDEISVRCFPGTECQQEVLEGRVDVGFALPPVDAELFDVLCGATYPLQLVVCKSHRLAGRASVRLSELRGERLVDLNAPRPAKKSCCSTAQNWGCSPASCSTVRIGNALWRCAARPERSVFTAGPGSGCPAIWRLWALPTLRPCGATWPLCASTAT